jgi:hypothetical protein
MRQTLRRQRDQHLRAGPEAFPLIPVAPAPDPCRRFERGRIAGAVQRAEKEGRSHREVLRQLPALIDGDFVDRGDNVLAFGLPGRGKTHFLAALGRELILRHSKRVLLRPAFKRVGQLLAAKG